MTGGLDELAEALGLDPLVPPTPPDPSFTTIVRTQGRRPDSLAEALASLAAQTHPDHETVLVVHHDDPNTLDSVAAGLPADGRPPRLRLVAATDGGRARPLNVGLAEATGDYVCFLDDDDLVTPEWLAAFADAARGNPGTMIRAVTLSQDWTTDGGEQPTRAIGPAERRFPDRFDLLAHLSHNETPLCSVAFPREAMRRFGLEFDDDLPVFEDWDLLMRVAQVCGVTSIDAETSLYRRLDHGNAHTAVEEARWHETHARVVDRLSARPVLIPVGDARRLAAAHFTPGGGSRHEAELDATRSELAALTRSPWRFVRVFAGRVTGALRSRIARRRRSG